MFRPEGSSPKPAGWWPVQPIYWFLTPAPVLLKKADKNIMAARKKQVHPEGSPEAEQVEMQKGKALYLGIVQSLAGMGPATYPVEFENERYFHLDHAQLKEKDPTTKGGVFVRIMDIHDQDAFSKLVAEQKKYHHPLCMLHLALKCACAFDGSPLFDMEDPKHKELLVSEADFTRDIFFEAMYCNGYYTRPEKTIAKNSAETPKLASESASANS